jgi:phenylpropionate dioxygenase-like ring-hydroxylating dioxygenase large terminal subunit
MLSAQDNALITQTSKGTPMGELFRRFWLPVLLPEELPEPDCPPVRIKIMGEYLVAFRDTNGQVGVVEAFCPHRRAPLFYGRNEECGLRCVYHGWKFDVTGQCVDMPSEPADSDFPSKVQIDAYPAREFGGVIWIYMGPPDKKPDALPQLEWALVPPEQRRVTKNFQECNYLQALEGDIDTAHVSYLHSTKKRLPQNHGVVRDVGRIDKAPRLMVLNHDAGFAYGGRRTVPDGGYYWRVTQFLWPTYAFIPAFSWPKTCTYTVPVDDHHCFRMSFAYNIEGSMEGVGRWLQPGEGVGPWSRTYGQYWFDDGLAIDTWLLDQNKRNHYFMDREKQRTESFTGISGIPTQDRAMTEGMGFICDRTKERLGTTDVAVIAARRGLIDMARNLEKGIEPYCATNAEAYRLRALDVVSPDGDLGPVLERYRDEITVTLPA